MVIRGTRSSGCELEVPVWLPVWLELSVLVMSPPCTRGSTAEWTGGLAASIAAGTPSLMRCPRLVSPA